MPHPCLTATDLTALRARVRAHDGAGIVVWCLEHGGFHDADPGVLRWVSPDGRVDIAVGAERGFDRQVLQLGEAILATWRPGDALARDDFEPDCAPA